MKPEFSAAEILKDSLVSICYALNEIDGEDQEAIDAIAVDMISEGVTDTEIGILAIFVEKLLTFYASDEAVPLLEGSLDANSFPPAPVLPVSEIANRYADDCPFDIDGETDDEIGPSDQELQEIESDSKGFLENLWEEPKESEKEIDFAFGANVVADEDEPEPDYSGLSRRERKRLKKARRAAKRDKNKQRRNEDYGFDNFEIYKGSKSSKSTKTFQEVIHYDFDVLDKVDENDQDIGRLVNASFEEKKESYFSSKPKFQSQSSFQSSSVGTPIPGLKLPSRIQQMIDTKPCVSEDDARAKIQEASEIMRRTAIRASNGNPFKRSYGWPDGDDFID